MSTVAPVDRTPGRVHAALEREIGCVEWHAPPTRDLPRLLASLSEDRAASTDRTVACLVPARPDTGWWWEFARYQEVRMIKGRLRFPGSTGAAPFPSAVIVFGRPPDVIYWDCWTSNHEREEQSA